MKTLYAIGFSLLAVVVATGCGQGFGQQPSPPRFKAIAFDYFVIFDAKDLVQNNCSKRRNVAILLLWQTQR
jgi:hypothetical protein